MYKSTITLEGTLSFSFLMSWIALGADCEFNENYFEKIECSFRIVRVPR